MKASINKGANPLERQLEESLEAFEAFQIYLRLGSSRSLVRVAEELGKSRQLIERWSARWQWATRLPRDRHQPKSGRGQQLLDDAKSRERTLKITRILQSHSAQKIARMTDADVARMTPMECVRLFKVATDLELKIRKISEKEMKDRDRARRDLLPVPRLIINFRRGTPEGMVGVRLPDGATGYIPIACASEFLEDYPDGKILWESVKPVRTVQT